MTAANKGRCVRCEKEKRGVRCEGCSQLFCFDHLPDHRQELNEQFDEIQVNRDLLRQSLTQQTTDPTKHVLIQQINQWEQDSIRKIQQNAKQCRESVLQHINEHLYQMEMKLGKLTDLIRQTRQENDFNEIDISEFKKKLKEMTEELNKPSNVLIEQNSAALIQQISVVGSAFSQYMSPGVRINQDTKWQKNGVTVAGGNGQGDALNQLSHPYGMCVDEDHQCIYIADHLNHRIIEWKYGAKSGRIVAGGNGQGDRSDQMNMPSAVVVDKKTDSLIISDSENERVVRWPRQNGAKGQILISDIRSYGLAIDKAGDLYVSNYDDNEVIRWKHGERNRTIVAGGNGEGNQLNQLNTPTYIFIDEFQTVYVADRDNNRVMKWKKDAKEGTIVAGRQGKGNELAQLSNPAGIFVDRSDNVYVSDGRNHRIMCWSQNSKTGNIIVAGNGTGTKSNQVYYPEDLSFDSQGNLYVVDCYNNRIQRFDIEKN